MSVRRRAVVAAAACVVAGGGVAAWLVTRAGAASQAPPGGAVTLGTATVRRMDVVETQALPGVLGYATPGTVVSQLVAAAPGATPAQAQAAVSAAEQQLAAARTALDDLRRVDAVTLAQAHAAVVRAQSQNDAPALAGAQEAEALAVPRARQAEDAGAAQVTSAQAALASAQRQLAAAVSGTPSVVTSLPAVGQAIDRGQSLFSVGGRPITLLIGAVPAYRNLAPGIADGPDVSQLADNLNQLGAGQGLATDGRWSAGLTSAVKHWQATLGVPQTGVVELGQVAFVPTPIRVTAIRTALGAIIPAGTPILDETSTSRTVSAQVPSAQAGLLHPGEAVTIALPDGRTVVGGHVASVAAATAQATGGQAPGQQAQQQNGAPQAQVTATVTLDAVASVAAFDVAPVTVTITVATAHRVLAVPVDALLALEAGGYAVEAVRSGGAHDMVVVTPGLFDGAAMVEVRGDDLTEGMTVVVPAP